MEKHFPHSSPLFNLPRWKNIHSISRNESQDPTQFGNCNQLSKMFQADKKFNIFFLLSILQHHIQNAFCATKINPTIANKNGFIILILHCAEFRIKHVLIYSDAHPFRRFMRKRCSSLNAVKLKIFLLIKSTPLCSSMPQIIKICYSEKMWRQVN